MRDVADLNGNTMASPLTMNVYVYRNPLRWDVKHLNFTAPYGEGITFEATVRNLSGQQQSFELLDLPVWIKASKMQGIINALDEERIVFTVSPFINENLLC